MGRSFVRLEYQSSKAGAKAIYALDNLWDGIGALTVVYPQIKSLFGKVTMYPNYSHLCRDMILYFMNHYFPDRDHLVTPIVPVKLTHDIDFLRSKFVNNDFAEDYRRLNKLVREAEANAAEDKKKQENIEARNQADALIYATEKSLISLQ